MANENFSNLRDQVDRLIDQTHWTAAGLCLAELWRKQRSSALAAFVVSRYEKLRGKVPLVPLRVAILRSFTVEPVVSLLRAEGFCFGLDVSAHIGDFNAYAQEILDSES